MESRHLKFYVLKKVRETTSKLFQAVLFSISFKRFKRFDLRRSRQSTFIVRFCYFIVENQHQCYCLLLILNSNCVCAFRAKRPAGARFSKDPVA